MADVVTKPMTADAFITWAMAQPEGNRHELMAGEVVAMAPERAAHARAKFHIARRLAEAVEAGHVACEVFTDGMTVVVDDITAFEPDALLRCGPAVPGTEVRISDPTIVVEVLSPSTALRDTTDKLAAYFRIPSIQHYLIVDPDSGAITHHQRQGDGTLLTRTTHAGDIRLDPPGITLTDPHPRRD